MGKVIGGVTDFFGATDTRATDRALPFQQQSTMDANRYLKEMYDESKTRFEPYRQAGLTSLNQYQDLPVYQSSYDKFSNVESPYRQSSGQFTMADFQKDPGYKFRLDEGMRAIERANNARGRTGSGASMKDLIKYGQDYASNEYQNAYNRFNQDYNNAYNRYNQDFATSYGVNTDNYNRNLNKLSNLMNLGYGAETTLAGQGMNVANIMGQNQIGYGNAAATAELHRNDDLKNLWGQGATLGTMALLA